MIPFSLNSSSSPNAGRFPSGYAWRIQVSASANTWRILVW
jgi:hypothetical protein